MKKLGFTSTIVSMLLLSQFSFALAAVPTVTLKSPTAIKSTSITLNASVGGATASTIYGFEYGLTIDYRYATNDFSNLKGTTFSKEIFGLQCNKEYHYRAYVENSSGRANTVDSVFKTAGCGSSDVGGSNGGNDTNSATFGGTNTDLTVPDSNFPSNTSSGSNSGNTNTTNTTNQAQDVKLDYSGWVKCDGVTTASEKDRQTTCNFVNLINTLKSLINWAFMISIPIIIGLLAYAGFLYMTGSEGHIKKAKEMMWNAIIGFVIMLSAWFIVTFVLNQLLTNEFKGVADTLLETKK